MQPMLDDLELPQVQEITTLDHRMLAEQKPPAMSGSLLQNLGRRPLRVELMGVATGPEALRFVEKLDEKFRAGTAFLFTGDIVADAQIEKVVIDDLRVQEEAGKPQRYQYALTLREFIEPVEPEDASALDTSIAEEALDIMDGLVDGLDLAQFFSTGLERFVAPLGELLGRLQQFNRDANG
jgi:hypothetical protein